MKILNVTDISSNQKQLEILVEKDLHDNLVFVAVVPKSETSARLLQRVDQLLCRLFNIHCFLSLLNCL